MNVSAWASDAWTIFRVGVARAWNFLKAHPAHLAFAVFVVVMFNLLLQYIASASDKKIIVYVGAPGSSSNRMAERVSKAIRDTGPTPGFKYQTLVVPTSGGWEIDEKVAADNDGRSIGISVDRINHPTGLQALLPLDWGYVHVIARLKFLLERRPTGDLPKEFSEVVQHLKYGRVYVDSESLELATKLFALYNIRDINDVLAPSLDNWAQASAALKADQIDLGFYSGPIGATTIQRLAETGSAVLLGLDNLSSTLSQDPDLTMISTKIPMNSYWASPLDNATEPPHYFCSRDLPTLATRRMIVTSRSMSDRDAYLITDALTARLTDANDVPVNTWRRDEPQSRGGSTDVAFGLAPHAGAQMQHSGVVMTDVWKPWTWSSAWRSIGIGLASVLLTAILSSLSGRLQPRAASPPAPPTPEPSDEFNRLRSSKKPSPK